MYFFSEKNHIQEKIAARKNTKSFCAQKHF